jgi:hypothetical protein
MLRVVTQPRTLCVPKRDAERHTRHYHAERGNDQTASRIAMLGCAAGLGAPVRSAR